MSKLGQQNHTNISHTASTAQLNTKILWSRNIITKSEAMTISMAISAAHSELIQRDITTCIKEMVILTTDRVSLFSISWLINLMLMALNSCTDAKEVMPFL